MAESLGPIEIDCDAPPYSIVQACRMIGLRSPEDVRWCRMTLRADELPWWRRVFSPQSWMHLLGMRRRGIDVCVCGAKLPMLERYTFLIVTGDKLSYLLGQCEHCSSIYWEDGASETARVYEESLRHDSSE
jgi:hypothetical protein